MYLDKITENDFFSSLEKKMNKIASFESNLKDKRLSNVLNFLASAEYNLKSVGLTKEAQLVVKLKEVCEDPAMPSSSEEMLNNLADKGWVFNAKDGEHNSDVCEIDDCSSCSEGDQPQLSQPELEQLRQLLKSDENHDMDEGDKEGVEGMFENMDPDDRSNMLKRLNEMF